MSSRRSSRERVFLPLRLRLRSRNTRPHYKPDSHYNWLHTDWGHSITFEVSTDRRFEMEKATRESALIEEPAGELAGIHFAREQDVTRRQNSTSDCLWVVVRSFATEQAQPQPELILSRQGACGRGCGGGSDAGRHD